MAKGKLFSTMESDSIVFLTLCVEGIHLHRLTMEGVGMGDVPLVTRCNKLCDAYPSLGEFEIEDQLILDLKFFHQL